MIARGGATVSEIETERGWGRERDRVRKTEVQRAGTGRERKRQGERETERGMAHCPWKVPLIMVRCSVSQFLTVCCSVLQCAAVFCNAVCCSMLQHSAVCCSMLSRAPECTASRVVLLSANQPYKWWLMWWKVMCSRVPPHWTTAFFLARPISKNMFLWLYFLALFHSTSVAVALSFYFGVSPSFAVLKKQMRFVTRPLSCVTWHIHMWKRPNLCVTRLIDKWHDSFVRDMSQ